MPDVYCYASKKGEVDGLTIMLEEKIFKLVFVDKNSIKAVKEGNYREVYQAGRNQKKKNLTSREGEKLQAKQV